MIPKTKTMRRQILAINSVVYLIVSFFTGIWISQPIRMPFDMKAYTDALFPALNPLRWAWNEYTWPCIGCVVGAFSLYMLYYLSMPHNYRDDAHGSAEWISTGSFNKDLKGKKEETNIILSNSARIGIDTRRHGHNLNTIVLGSPGTGKSRGYVMPNLLEQGCARTCSFVVTDPKGELLRKTGRIFAELFGYKVKVLNLIDPKASDPFNPFRYLRNEETVLSLVTSLIKNTTPPGQHANDPFWEKAETFLVAAVCMFLWEAVPVREQNFGNVIKLLGNATAKEDGNEMSVLDIIFSDYAQVVPSSIAISLYETFKEHAKGKTLQSILITASSRLIHFKFPQIQEMTNEDAMDFGLMATIPTIVYCVIPDDDTSFNHIAAMFYTSYFQAMYRKSFEEYDSEALPLHQRIVLDEFANIQLPEDFLHVLSTARSRNISLTIIIQSLDQLKKLFEKDWETVLDNCEIMIYLGCNGKTTNEYMSAQLGKETIDKRSWSIGKGSKGSSSETQDRMQRELMTPDELRRLDRKWCVVLLANTAPLLDRKFDVSKHKLYKKSGIYKKELQYVHHPLRVSMAGIPLRTVANTVPPEEIIGYEF